MTRRFHHAAFALCVIALSALAAAPLAAGPIYLPIGLHETDGGYVRNTDIWVTNPDTVTQGFVVRYIAQLANGTTRTQGDETGPYYVGAGETKRYSELIPAGFRGLLEIDGAAMLEFNGMLTTRGLQGAIAHESEIPLLTQVDLAPAGGSLWLQAWERSGTTTTTNLGIVNLSQVAAHCTVDVRQKDGLLIVQGVGLDLAPLTVVQFDDALGILGQTTVQAGARARVSCNQTFWAYSSVYDDQSGGVDFIEPSSSIGSSTLVQPAGPPGGGGGGTEPDAVVFTLPGEFLNCAPCDHWNYHMNTGGAEFTKIIMDFDVHVGRWDSHRPSGFHNVVWIQNGGSWGNMIAYLNSKGSQGRMTFQVNDGVGQENNQSPGMQTDTDYHIRYEYNLVDHFVRYQIFQNGTQRTRGEYAISHGVHSIRPSGFFAAFGGQSAAGPEAATPGWRFSNLVAQFVP